MNVGPPRMAMIMATSAATRTLATRMKFSATTSSPTERDPLTSTTSPGRRRSRRSADGLGGSVRPGYRRSRGERADGDDVADPELAQQGADLTVVGGRAGAELGHLAEHGDRAGFPPARCTRCSSAARIETGFAL